MRTPHIHGAAWVLVLLAAAARTASAQTCIAIDQAHDTLAPDERTAAALLLGKQFELAGQHVAESGCAETYTLSHIRLGTTIVVTLSGPKGSRQGTALGLEDLPAVYSQMVRSLVTGQPMGTLAVLDRTNVSASQNLPPRRLQSDGYWHARVGYASLFSPSVQSAASFGFGYRAEFDRVGLDVSFLNFQLNDSEGYYGNGSAAMALIKLEGLYFTNPSGNQSTYFGGGLSYGHTSLRLSNNGNYPTSGDGSGLQGELTAGYEIARVTSARLYVQADATMPFYHVNFETFSYPQGTSSNRYAGPPTVTVRRQYVPSLTVSVGIGWQRRR
jgi:hypothetical protein